MSALGGPRTRATRVVLDRLHVWRGSRLLPVQLGEVERWVAHASRSYGRAPACFDAWQALNIAQRLRARGHRVDTVAFTQQSNGRRAAILHQPIRQHLLAIPDLLDELANVLALGAEALLDTPSPARVRIATLADRAI